MSPSSKNMLRFRTENSGPNSPYSSSILGQDSGFSSESSTPPKPVRKVPKTPHKVVMTELLLCLFFFFLPPWLIIFISSRFGLLGFDLELGEGVIDEFDFFCLICFFYFN